MSSIRFTPPPEPLPFTLANEVFGVIRGKIPKNYVERSDVDFVLQSAIARRQHVVIHGSSKQGKTCLRRVHLKKEDCIEITCMSAWELVDIHRSILKKAGYQFPGSATVTDSTQQSKLAKRGVKFKAGDIAEIGLDGEDGRVDQRERQRSFERPAIDLADANEVIEALDELQFRLTIVLEDFHYLKVEVQQQFAVALKAFFDSSDQQFVIVGVWLDKNRLVQYNGDLGGRIVAVDADEWTLDKLEEVIVKGERLLDLTFHQDFKRHLLANCMNSVWVVQEVCYRTCAREGVMSQAARRSAIGSKSMAIELIREVVDSSTARYTTFITGFSAGNDATLLDLHRWILAPILFSDTESMGDGIRLEDLRAFIEAHHPMVRNNPSAPVHISRYELVDALNNMGALQANVRVNPIVLDFDQGLKTLNVVDRAFLIWLKHQDRKDLMRQADLPDDLIQEWVRENRGRRKWTMITLADGSRSMVRQHENSEDS